MASKVVSVDPAYIRASHQCDPQSLSALGLTAAEAVGVGLQAVQDYMAIAAQAALFSDSDFSSAAKFAQDFETEMSKQSRKP